MEPTPTEGSQAKKTNRSVSYSPNSSNNSSNNSNVPKRQRQRSKRSSSNSKTPSSEASNRGGKHQLNERLRSVLYDDVGLPLVCKFDDKDPKEVLKDVLDGSGTPSNTSQPIDQSNDDRWDGILEESVNEWREEKEEPQLEPQLCSMLKKKINECDGKLVEEKLLEKKFRWNARTEVTVVQGQIEGRIDLILEKHVTQKTTEGMQKTTQDTQNKTQDSQETPYMVIEVGRTGGDNWWKKFDQAVKYLDLMVPKLKASEEGRKESEVKGPKGSKGKGPKGSKQRPKGSEQHPKDRPTFVKRLLLAVVTFDEKIPHKELDMTLGVFLCIPPRENTNFRMSYLWSTKTITRNKGSMAFGKLLRIAKDFQQWREGGSSELGILKEKCEHFSSNCCRVGKYVSCRLNPMVSFLYCMCRSCVVVVVFLMIVHTVYPHPHAIARGDLRTLDPIFMQVLRCYDSRIRRTDRRADVYLNTSLKNIHSDNSGRGVKKIIEIEKSHDQIVLKHQGSSSASTTRALTVLAVPYREGSHKVSKIKSFIPIIKQLEELHKAGFVHGDIRAFNVVFGESETENKDGKKNVPGFLIDFDFSGEPGLSYPEGYNRNLDDGRRIGGVEEHEKMEEWHDWYALGMLIFHIHRIGIPEGNVANLKEFIRMRDFWLDLERQPEDKEIEHLKQLLGELDDANYTIKPCTQLHLMLKNSNEPTSAKKKGATGSPPKQLAK